MKYNRQYIAGTQCPFYVVIKKSGVDYADQIFIDTGELVSFSL